MRDYNVFFARLVARFLDSLLVGLGILALNYFLPLPEWASLILTDTLYAVYFIYFHFKQGQTPAKKLFYIKVVNYFDGVSITLRQAIQREILWIVAGIASLSALFLEACIPGITEYINENNGLIDLIILVSIILASDHRGIHDKLAGTKVVRVK